MVELTSSRVDKSQKFAVAPKVRPRSRPSHTPAPATTEGDPKEPEEPGPVSKKKVRFDLEEQGPVEPVVAPIVPLAPVEEEEELPTLSSVIPNEILPRTPPLVHTAKNSASLLKMAKPITIPSAMRPSSDTETRDDSGDDDEAPAISLKDLIASKFEHGVRSKYEEARQQEVKEARKRRKLGKKEETMKHEEKTKMLKADPGPSVVQSRGPQLRMVNGEMVLDEASLVVEAPEGPKEGDLQRVEEGALRYVSSASFRTRAKAGRVKWTPAMTDRFYEGLSYFGTDFGLTSLLFPGITRQQIKLKFNAEERSHISRVNAALMNRQTPDETVKARMKSLLLKKQSEKSQVQVPVPAASDDQGSESKRGPEIVNQEAENTDQDDHFADKAPDNGSPILETPTLLDQSLTEKSAKAFEDAIQSVRVLPMADKTRKGPKIGPKLGVRARKKAGPSSQS